MNGPRTEHARTNSPEEHGPVQGLTSLRKHLINQDHE